MPLVNTKRRRFFLILPLCFTSHVVSSTSTTTHSHMQILTAGQSIGGVEFPSGTEVEILDGSNRPSGYVILHSDFLFNKIILKNGTRLWISGPKIHLLSFTSMPHQKIYGIPLPSGSKVNLYDNGNIREIYANRPIAIRGITYAKWRWIRFYKNGHIQDGKLAKNTIFSELHARPGPVEFYENGKLKEADIISGSFYRGLKLASDTNATNGPDVTLWNNGNLKSGILYTTTTLDGKKCAPGNVAFSKTGTLESCNE